MQKKNTHRLTLNKIFIFFLYFLVVFQSLMQISCATQNTAIRHKEEDKEYLMFASKQFWSAVQWEDTSKALDVTQQGSNQGILFDYLMSHNGKTKITDVNVHHVTIDDKRTFATVFVTYQLMLPDRDSVFQKNIQQTWIYKNGKWYLQIVPKDLTWLDI